MKVKKVNSIEIKTKEPAIDCMVLEKKIKVMINVFRDVNLGDYKNMDKKNIRAQLDELTAAIYDMEVR